MNQKMLPNMPIQPTSSNSDVKGKNLRKRMTNSERQSFIEQCVTRYKEGRSTKLIAYELGVRESDVKQALFDFVQKHPDQIIKTKVFLATPNTRMKDIGSTVVTSNFYEVEVQDDNTLICIPLQQSSSSVSA